MVDAELRPWLWARSGSVASFLLFLTSPAKADACRDQLDRMASWLAAGEYWRLSDDHEGVALPGAPGEAEAITDWFAGYGWRLVTEVHWEPRRSGTPGHECWSDGGFNDGLPERGFWALLGMDCAWMAHITMHQNRIIR